MDSNACPTCGKGVADHPDGLCPASLLENALSSELDALRCLNCESTISRDAHFCANCGAASTAATTPEGDPLQKALEAKLHGQYRIIRLLGSGGMGSVYLARDLALEREVAIKVVKSVSEGRDTYDRFRREARTAAKLSHPNIVPLHAFGEVEGMPYFVMGYVRGESLANRLRREGKLSEEEGRRIFAEIADALDHAHRQGVVHRDIKPDNVLIEDESGRALLTDFGVAKASGKGETLTRLGSVVGTPQYMSPEQASGRIDIDGRSDLYSLGVMAFAMFSARLPFQGNSASDVLMKHLTQQPPSLRSIVPALSDATVQAVERCLLKDRAARWPDARSLKLTLGAVEQSQLPDALQSIDGRGVIGLTLGVAWLLFIWFFVIAGDGAPVQVFYVNTGVVAFLYAFVIVSLRREGFSFLQSHEILWREPSWWLWWYPRRLRRPGNVWDRLPSAVRSLRWGLPIFVILFVSIFIIGDFPNVYESPVAFAIKMAGFVGWIIVWEVLTVRARRAVRLTGLGFADGRRVMISVPPSRLSFWSKPHIAAVLAPEPRGEASRRGGTPHDQLQAILRDAEELRGELRPLGTDAAVAARQLIASIEAADRQIVEIARNIEPGEQERLREKIVALVVPPDGDDDYAPMRALLQRQLELIGGLSARIEETENRRNRRIEMLRTLALHVASLRSRAETPSEKLSLSDNVRGLCNAIAQETTAIAEKSAATTAIDQATLRR